MNRTKIRMIRSVLRRLGMNRLRRFGMNRQWTHQYDERTVATMQIDDQPHELLVCTGAKFAFLYGRLFQDDSKYFLGTVTWAGMKSYSLTSTKKLCGLWMERSREHRLDTVYEQ